jgi:ABC-2 type transport system ATP-binding protein/ribosome-dependent ATPase
MTEFVLQARSLTRVFGGHIAVDDVAFDVGFGEVVGLLGANGAGKTTTIRMLVGLLEPSAGDAMLLGAPPNRGTQRRLGYVPQGLGLYRDLTVAENLTFTAHAYDIEPSALIGSLAASSDRLVRDIPLGLQRQLAFASAVQHTPEVLILDEPTSGVGPLGAARLWDQIRKEAERGAGVLVTTHSMQEARQCDRLVLLSDGAVVGRGTESDIVAGLTAVEVTADRWSDAFNALTKSSALVTLDGRSVRVIDQSPGAVERTLVGAGVTATIEVLPATIDERMASLAAAASGTKADR